MAHLAHLAINNQGFVFDPTSGTSFTVNTTGLQILHGLCDEKATSTIAEELIDAYDISLTMAEQDIAEFVAHLRSYHLL